MKFNLSHLSIVFTIALFSSCTIQKRIHQPGYHVEFKKKYSTQNPIEETTFIESKENVDLVKTERKISSQIDSTLIQKKIEETAFESNKYVARNAINQKEKYSSALNSFYSNSVKNRSFEIKKATDLKAKKTKKSYPKPENTTGGLGIAGWVLFIIGILILLFLSILIGIIVIVLGLTFILSNASMKSKKKTPTDVVYLKNGSIIRGQIIEQIPNQSLKIRTNDGSVFVYKMEEVEKIVKEM
ncbi:MAG: hypothetical protein ACK479_08835 [Fluviicola sp.]|jgi:hypothetical protein